MSQRTELVGLQLLRGLCATAVVFDHVSTMALLPKNFGRTVFNNALVEGKMGVDLFFVVSGFIITIVALQGRELAPSVSIRSFFARRFARIVPLMWLAILVFAGLRGLHDPGEMLRVEYLRALTLWPRGAVEPDVIWTLRHEAVFYVVFAASFLGPRWLRPLLFVWFLSPLAYGAATGHLFVVNYDTQFWPLLFDGSNLEFGAGFLVGLVWLRSGGLRTLRLPLSPLVLVLALMIGVIAVVAAMPFMWRSFPACLLLAVLGAGVITVAVRISCPPARLTQWGRLLGDASYSVYLFHPVIVSALMAVAASRLRAAPVGPVLLVIAAAAIGGGVLVHLLVEKRLVRLVQGWLRPRPATMPVILEDGSPLHGGGAAPLG